MAVYKTVRELNLAGKKAGDGIYAFAFEMTRDKLGARLSQKPVKGMLAASNTEEGHDYFMGKAPAGAYGRSFLPTRHPAIRHFVPEKASGHGHAWSKAVNVEARAYADTLEEAVREYNAMVRKQSDWLRERAAEIDAVLDPRGMEN